MVTTKSRLREVLIAKLETIANMDSRLPSKGDRMNKKFAEEYLAVLRGEDVGRVVNYAKIYATAERFVDRVSRTGYYNMPKVKRRFIIIQ